MAEDPKEQSGNEAEPPAAEVLQPQDETAASSGVSSPEARPQIDAVAAAKRTKRLTYRPSHKATFIGVAVIVAILGVNVVVIAFVLRDQTASETKKSTASISISPEALDKLGVSTESVGGSGAELTVNPNARFNGKVMVGGDVTIAGQFKLNSKLTADDASFAKLQAGDTSVNQMTVNGDATATNLNLRKDVTVVGSSRLQGPVTVNQLLTVNNNLNVTGSLSVGGTLTVRSLKVSTLSTDTGITIGGHIITRGNAPSVSPGGSLGSNGNVSISGNDTSGTVAVNIGAGGGGGTVAAVTFRSGYSTTPHVVVTAVGQGAGSVYVNRSGSGFSIGVNGALAPGGYAFDYIVVQ